MALFVEIKSTKTLKPVKYFIIHKITSLMSEVVLFYERILKRLRSNFKEFFKKLNFREGKLIVFYPYFC
jgi:hypothetical protein